MAYKELYWPNCLRIKIECRLQLLNSLYFHVACVPVWTCKYGPGNINIASHSVNLFIDSFFKAQFTRQINLDFFLYGILTSKSSN